MRLQIKSTSRAIRVLARLVVLITGMLLLCQFVSAATLYTSYGFGQGTVGVYDAATGAPINAALLETYSPTALVVSGNTLYLGGGGNFGEGSVGTYDATTGATINQNFITSLDDPFGMTISGGSLYVSNWAGLFVGAYDAGSGAAQPGGFGNGYSPSGVAVSGNTGYVANAGYGVGRVSEFNASTGAVINNDFVTGLNQNGNPNQNLAVSGNNLYIADPDEGVIVCEASTGAVVNGDLIPGLTNVAGLAVLGDDLYVSNGSTVSEYDASTGALIPGFTPVPGTDVFATEAPEPASLAVLAFAGIAILRRRRPSWKRAMRESPLVLAFG